MMENTNKNLKLKKTIHKVWQKMPLVNKGWEILLNKKKEPDVNEIELGRSF